MIKVFGARRLERGHLASLRIYPRHHVFDSAVFPRSIHRLKDEQHRPAVLRVKNVLQLREGLDTGTQRLLRPRLVFGREFARVVWTYFGKPEFLSVRDAIRL